MSDENVRDRLILPILIPVGALALVLFLALLMSQILLNVPPSVATAVALMTAFNLLVAFSVMAAKPFSGRPLMVLLSGVVAVPLVLGAAAAAGAIPLAGLEEEHGAETPQVHIAANNLQFETDELTIPADTEFELVFDNQESQPHNVSILPSEGASTKLFTGEIVTGPVELTATVEPIEPGEFYFQCDVHPTMNGTLVATEDFASGEGSAEEH